MLDVVSLFMPRFCHALKLLRPKNHQLMAFKKYKLIDDVVDRYQLSFKKENFQVHVRIPQKNDLYVYSLFERYLFKQYLTFNLPIISVF